jgi:glutamate synthase (NADPH/NADH) small chain
VEWKNGDDGRPRPVPVPGTEQTEPCDLAFLAMGFTGAEPGTLAPEGGLGPCGPGRLVAPKIYSAGDAATGPSLVVRAMADGLAVGRALLYAEKAGAYPQIGPKEKAETATPPLGV